MDLANLSLDFQQVIFLLFLTIMAPNQFKSPFDLLSSALTFVCFSCCLQFFIQGCMNTESQQIFYFIFSGKDYPSKVSLFLWQRIQLIAMKWLILKIYIFFLQILKQLTWCRLCQEYQSFLLWFGLDNYVMHNLSGIVSIICMVLSLNLLFASYVLKQFSISNITFLTVEIIITNSD